MAKKDKKLLKMVNLYEDFTGHEPDKIYTLDLDNPETAMVVGILKGVIYETVRDDKLESYIHEFDEKSAPLLAIGDDLKTLLVLDGDFVFTDRGIEDVN